MPGGKINARLLDTEQHAAHGLAWLATYAATLRELANFARIQQVRITQGMRPIPTSYHSVYTGNPGTGKTHLATALGFAACTQGKRVRFATAAGLINELVEAQAQLRLSKVEAALRTRQAPPPPAPPLRTFGFGRRHFGPLSTQTLSFGGRLSSDRFRLPRSPRFWAWRARRPRSNWRLSLLTQSLGCRKRRRSTASF